MQRSRQALSVGGDKVQVKLEQSDTKDDGFSSPGCASTEDLGCVTHAVVPRGVRDAIFKAPEHTSDDFAACLPVGDLSLTARFPTASWSQPVSRSRGTINAYCDMLQQICWHASFKPPTIAALERRLKQHEAGVMGHSEPDVHIAYNHLLHRLASLSAAHKVLRTWASTGDNKDLVEILVPFGELAKYMEAVKGLWAPDLTMIAMSAKFFQQHLKDPMNTASLIENFDFKTFEELGKELALRTADQAEHPARRQPEPEPDANLEREAACLGSAKQHVAKRRKKLENHQVMLEAITAGLRRPARDQFACLVLSVLRPQIAQLPTDAVDQPKTVEALCSSWASILDRWSTAVGDQSQEHSFTQVLSASLVIFQCSLADERGRPTVSSVRAARRCILSSAMGQIKDSSAATLCKSLMVGASLPFLTRAKEPVGANGPQPS